MKIKKNDHEILSRMTILILTCDQNFIIVLFDDKTMISTIIRGDFPLSNNFVNLFPLSHSHAVCRNTQTLKIRHYCFVHIINVKCFTENITKVRIVGSYRFFREKNSKYELRHNNFIYSRNRNLNCGIRNSESQISNILLISILKFGIIYRLDFGPISKYANLVLQSPL